MSWVLFFWAPLVLGALWGAWQGRRDRFSFSVLLAAPIFSAGLLAGAIVAVMAADMLCRTPSGTPNPNNTDLLGLVAVLLAAIFGYGVGFFLFGAVPAVLGSTAAQLGKLWVVHRHSGICGDRGRLTGNEDIENTQAESDVTPEGRGLTGDDR
jgi:hypothetical protein